jgi:hypothetical protein
LDAVTLEHGNAARDVFPIRTLAGLCFLQNGPYVQFVQLSNALDTECGLPSRFLKLMSQVNGEWSVRRWNSYP